MAMPTDGINTLLAYNPLQLWVLNETVGTSFADQVVSAPPSYTGASPAWANMPLTIANAANCVPGGWPTTMYGYRQVGGPQTPCPYFDGTANAFASASQGAIARWMKNLGGLSTTTSGTQSFPEATVTVASTAGFPAQGGVLTIAGVTGNVTYTGISGSTFTGCSGGTGTNIAGGAAVALKSAGFGIICMFNSLEGAPATTNRTLYAEATASSTDRLVFSWTNGSQLQLQYKDDTATAATATNTGPNSMFGGESISLLKGGQLVGVSVAPSGACTFYRDGQFGPIPSTTLLALDTSKWATSPGAASLTTSIGLDAANAGNAFFGALGWVCVFPFGYTPEQFDAFYQAICPNPPHGAPWAKALSGSVLPNSEFWNKKLSDNASVDPNSSSIISQWLSMGYTNSSTATMTAQIPMFNLDQTGRNPVMGARGAFLGGSADGVTINGGADELTVIGNIPLPDAYAVTQPVPGNAGFDAIGAVCQPSSGLVADTYHTQSILPPGNAARHGLYNPYLNPGNSTMAALSGGTLAPGWYYYALSYVASDGTEGPCLYLSATPTNQGVQLTGTGKITVPYAVDLRGSNPPVSINVYRRGAYGVVTGGGSDRHGWRDFGLLTNIPISQVQETPAINTFVDDGSYGAPDTTKMPLQYHDNTTVTWLVSGTNNSGQNVLTVRVPSPLPDPYATTNPPGPTNPTYGLGPNVKLTIGTGGTQEVAYIKTVLNSTQVTLWKNLVNTHSDGETAVSAGYLWGTAGTAFQVDWAAQGGGGCYDWNANAGFYPHIQPSGWNSNGQSASSRPSHGGTITAEEMLGFAATLTASPPTLPASTVAVVSIPANTPTVGRLTIAGVQGQVAYTGISGNTFTGCTGGSGTPAAGALVRASAGINHPIAVAIGINNQLTGSSGTDRWPAKNHDGGSGDVTHNFPTIEGMRIRLPAGTSYENGVLNLQASSRNVVALGWLADFIIAVRDYGFIDNDSTTGNGLVNIYVEDTPQSGRESFTQALRGFHRGAINQQSFLDAFFGYQVTATSAIGSNVLTSATALHGGSLAATTNNFPVGSPITGTGIPAGTFIGATTTTTITLVDVNGNQVNATANGTATFTAGAAQFMQVLKAFRFGAKTTPIVQGAPVTFTATTASGSPTLTSVSSFANLQNGMVLSGPGIPDGTTIYRGTPSGSGLNPGASQVTMSNPAFANASVTITASRRTNRTDVGVLNTPGFQQVVPY